MLNKNMAEATNYVSLLKNIRIQQVGHFILKVVFLRWSPCWRQNAAFLPQVAAIWHQVPLFGNRTIFFALGYILYSLGSAIQVYVGGKSSRLSWAELHQQ